MPKTSWREIDKPHGPKTSTDYKRMYDLKERAQNAMDDLITILEIIGSVSDHPELDFAKIFKDEERYAKMMRVCREAYRKSYESKARLINEKNTYFLWTAAAKAGLYVSEKDLFNADKRATLVKSLRKLGKRDGQDYLKKIADDAYLEQYRAKNIWLAICPTCHLEQLPITSIDPCPKCGFKGPVFPKSEYFPRELYSSAPQSTSP